MPAIPSSFQRYARERAWSCGKELPGVAALRVVLADRAPGALAQVRAPLVPRVRGEEVVLGAAGRLGEPRVLGGRGLRRMRQLSLPESSGVRSKRCQPHGASATYSPSRRSSPLRSYARRRPRRRAASRSRAGRPTAARRGPPPARRRGSRRRACADVAAPAPADEVLPGVVAVPAAALAELPLAARGRRGRASAREQPLVERAQLDVGPARPAGGRGRPASCTVRPSSWPSWTSRAPVWLSVATAAARALLRREGRRRARLVVVLDEADEPLLVAEVGRQVAVHRLGAVVRRAGRRAACRSSSRSPAAGAPTPGPSTPRR